MALLCETRRVEDAGGTVTQIDALDMSEMVIINVCRNEEHNFFLTGCATLNINNFPHRSFPLQLPLQYIGLDAARMWMFPSIRFHSLSRCPTWPPFIFISFHIQNRKFFHLRANQSQIACCLGTALTSFSLKLSHSCVFHWIHIVWSIVFGSVCVCEYGFRFL